MQGYDNLRPRPGYFENNSGNGNNFGNAYGNNGYGNNGYGNPNFQNPQPGFDERVYVTGRAGADAYQLPRGVNRQVLWDNDDDRFYIKGYDNNGRQRVLGDFDFQEHVEPEPVNYSNIDLTPYATKDDIKKMIGEALSNAYSTNLAGYVTKDYLDHALSELSVGNGGRVVRNNESNA